jgi:Carboxypeptidase regulatory-like domain/TonB-dependent Receptor Plug Domain/Sel1 repeat
MTLDPHRLRTLGGVPVQRAAFLLLAIELCAPRPAASQRAERLYGSACDDGDLVACNVFGLMHETGTGVARDLNRARELYQRACDGGELAGCTNLGLIYGRGLGVSTDLERARGSYRVACYGGDTLGCDLLAALDSAQAGGPGTSDTRDTRYLEVGRVSDAVNARGLSNAMVEVPEVGLTVVSDDEGRVSLGRLPPGRYYITASRFGYESVDGTLEVPGSAEFLILMDRARIDDPLSTGRIEGRVTDAGSYEALSNVDVTVVGQERGRVLSDARGRFLLRDVKPGLVELQLQRIGYAPRTMMLVVQPGGTGQVTTTMSTEAIELAGINVTASASSAWLERNGFTERARRGQGRQFTREQLDRIHVYQVSDAVRHVPGVTVMPAGDSQTPQVPLHVVALNNRDQAHGFCVLPVFIDGIPQPTADLDQLPEDDIDAMEVYVGNDAPIQYSGGQHCGAVLIWRKR